MVNFLMAYVGSAVARSREAGLSPLEWTVYRPRRTHVMAENQPADAKSIDDATMRQHYSRKAHREQKNSGQTLNHQSTKPTGTIPTRRPKGS